MKRIILTSLLAIITILSFSQKVDTVINNPILKSYFSYQTHGPLFVVYKLYHGGGDCSRKTMHFSTGDIKNSATSKDYAHNGYDEGHMANSEDFAYDCDKDLHTFFFYNALPQTANLNRGCWKHLETQVRKESQSDSLLIICGGFGFTKKMGEVSVPDYCFKIIKNLKSNKFECYLFTNTDNATSETMELQQLLNNIPFANSIKQILNIK